LASERFIYILSSDCSHLITRSNARKKKNVDEEIDIYRCNVGETSDSYCDNVNFHSLQLSLNPYLHICKLYCIFVDQIKIIR